MKVLARLVRTTQVSDKDLTCYDCCAVMAMDGLGPQNLASQIGKFVVFPAAPRCSQGGQHPETGGLARSKCLLIGAIEAKYDCECLPNLE